MQIPKASTAALQTRIKSAVGSCLYIQDHINLASCSLPNSTFDFTSGFASPDTKVPNSWKNSGCVQHVVFTGFFISQGLKHKGQKHVLHACCKVCLLVVFALQSVEKWKRSFIFNPLKFAVSWTRKMRCSYCNCKSLSATYFCDCELLGSGRTGKTVARCTYHRGQQNIQRRWVNVVTNLQWGSIVSFWSRRTSYSWDLCPCIFLRKTEDKREWRRKDWESEVIQNGSFFPHQTK